MHCFRRAGYVYSVNLPSIGNYVPLDFFCSSFSLGCTRLTAWLNKVILAVGTKLQSIITRMAIEIQEKHAVVQGIPLVQVSDHHFWFSKPTLVLHLIHLTLFQVLFLWFLNHFYLLILLKPCFRTSQNAFEITYFIWITVQLPLLSHEMLASVHQQMLKRSCFWCSMNLVCIHVSTSISFLLWSELE